MSIFCFLLLAGVFTMFQPIWKFACRTALLAGLLLAFFVFLELLRAYAFFHRLNPIIGIGYLVVLFIFAIYSFFSIRKSWNRIPRILLAPELPHELQQASFEQLNDYAHYLIDYMERLSRNHLLDAGRLKQLRAGIAGLEDVFSAHPLLDDLLREIELIEERILIPINAVLEEAAIEEINISVNKIMQGATISPYHSIDAFIVLYQNACMTNRILAIFDGSITKFEQPWIYRDLIRLLSSVRILCMERTLMEGLFTSLPAIGHADHISQGLCAGLLSSTTGYATILRCTTFRYWDNQKASHRLRGQTRDYIIHVRNTFIQNILPLLKIHILHAPGADVQIDSGLWNTITQGIHTAIDHATSTMDRSLLSPFLL